MMQNFSCTSFRVIMLGFLLLAFEAKGQRKLFDNVSVSGTYYYGFILPEYSSLTYLTVDPVQSVSLSISRQTKGKTIWEQLYNFPEYGVTFFYSTLGNDSVNGREVAIFPHFALSIISREKFSFYNQTGIGICYVTRKYDPVDNYLNVAVGSHLNIHFNLRFGVSYRLTEKMQFHTGLSFEHFSNAKTYHPNLGLNYVTGYTGLKYHIGKRQVVQVQEMEPHVKKKELEFIFSCGNKRPSALTDKNYFTASATVEWKWHPFRVLHLGIGTDAFYDTSTEIEMATLQAEGYKPIHDIRTGLHFSQEFQYSKFSLIVQEGIYIGLTDKVNKRMMYNRAIIRYRASKKAFMQVAMKSHLHILDYPEVGLGYSW